MCQKGGGGATFIVMSICMTITSSLLNAYEIVKKFKELFNLKYIIKYK